MSVDVVPGVPPDLGLPRSQCSSSVGLGVPPVPFLQKRIQGLDSSSDDSSRCPAPSGDELSVDVVPDGPPDLGLPRPQCSSSVGLGVIPVPFLQKRIQGLDSSSDDNPRCPAPGGDAAAGGDEMSLNGVLSKAVRCKQKSIPGFDSDSDGDVRRSAFRVDDTSDKKDNGLQRLLELWEGGHVVRPGRHSSDEDVIDGGCDGQGPTCGPRRSVRGQRKTQKDRYIDRVALSDAEKAAAAVQFQPLVVQEQNCQALLWNQGRGRVQCRLLPMPGTRLCRQHKNAPHGEVRGPIQSNKIRLVSHRSSEAGEG